MHPHLIAYLLTIFTTQSISAASVEDLISGKNIYLKIKKDSIEINKKIFETYESQKTKKIIAVCPQSSATYSIVARWNINILSKNEAEHEAHLLCQESGAISGKLIGYKINKEIIF